MTTVSSKDNGSSGTPTPLLATGEQQIIVSQRKIIVFTQTFPHSTKVACRIRPMTEEEILQGATIISHKVAEDNVRISHRQSIVFSSLFLLIY